MPQVSRENLRKVENFFVKQTKETGSNEIRVPVVDIAEGADVALATAHRALKTMEKSGIITVIKPSSRRFPITYVYNGDIEDFEANTSKENQIEYLKKAVADRDAKIKELQERIITLEIAGRNGANSGDRLSR